MKIHKETLRCKYEIKYTDSDEEEIEEEEE